MKNKKKEKKKQNENLNKALAVCIYYANKLSEYIHEHEKVC